MLSTLRRLTAVVLACCLLTSAACDSQILTASNDVLASLKSAQPLINQLTPKAAPKIDNAVTIASKIVAAVKASDSNTAVALLSDLVPVFQSIVNNDLHGLSAAQQTQILAALALADIGLHILVNHLKSNAPMVAAAIPDVKARALDSFAAEETWGNRYKRK